MPPVKWTGTLTPDGASESGGHRWCSEAGRHHIDGHRRAGLTANRIAILNGKAEDGKITFELKMGDEAVAKFTLVHEGEEIKGDVKLERGGADADGQAWP